MNEEAFYMDDVIIQNQLDGESKESQDRTAHDAGFGCLHKYANTNLLSMEKLAWPYAAAEKHAKNFSLTDVQTPEKEDM